jgi:micrococcal nuclease
LLLSDHLLFAMRLLPAHGLLLTLSLSGAPVSAEPFAARVVAVHDGDTVSVLRSDRERLRIRLQGIDCPELHQAYGRRAKRLTSDLVFGRRVTVVPLEEDAYGRLVARVLLDGEDLSLTLVRQGLAWHYKRHSRDRELAAAERRARSDRVGLWADRDPLPPWEWRREHPRN